MHAGMHRQSSMLMQQAPNGQAVQHNQQQNMNNYQNQQSKQQVDYNLDLMTGFLMGGPGSGKP